MEFTRVLKYRRCCANSSNLPLKQNILTTSSYFKILKNYIHLFTISKALEISGKKYSLGGVWAVVFAHHRGLHQRNLPWHSSVCPYGCFSLHSEYALALFYSPGIYAVKFLSRTTLSDGKLTSQNRRTRMAIFLNMQARLYGQQ